MAAEQYANTPQDTLNGAIDNVQVSIVLNDASEFSSAGDYRIVIESEILKVTARSGNTLTVVRGQEGTTAASHGNGTAVAQALTRDGLLALFTRGIVQDTYANRPAAGLENRLFVPTDGLVGGIDTGSAWNHLGPRLTRLAPPPLVSALTWLNQGTATATDNNGTLYFEIPSGSGDNVRGLYKAIPAAPFTLEALFEPIWSGQAFARAGMFLYDSVSAELITHWWDTGTGPLAAGPTVVSSNWNSVTSFSGNITASADHFNLLRRWFGIVPVWFRIRDDNTNHHFEFSVDRVKWFKTGQQARTGFLTATHWGIAMEGFNSTAKNGMVLYHFRES